MLFHDGKFCFLHSRFFNVLRAISFYMILNDDHPIILLIFQKGPNVIHHLIIGFFHFELLHRHPDICIYRVGLGHFNTIICFVEIDTDSTCNYR